MDLMEALRSKRLLWLEARHAAAGANTPAALMAAGDDSMAKAGKLDAARDAFAVDMAALARAARLASPTPEQSGELDRLMEGVAE